MNAFHGRTYGAMSLSRLEADAAPRLLAARARHPPCPLRRPRQRRAPCSARSARPTSWRRSSSSRSREKGATSCPPPISCRACAGSAIEHGVLLVFDEVQSGIGRTGKMFASEHWGVAGDIVCLAKGIANGLPLGAIVARASVMDWPSGSHASTFGGNPVACAASLATLRLLEEPLPRQRRVGAAGSFARASPPWPSRFSFIREVRGLGLMIGVEIQSETGEPGARLARPSSSTWRSIAGCSCCRAARARSGSARLCA